MYKYFSTPYTSLLHNLTEDKFIALIEITFKREDTPYLACYDRNFRAAEKYHAWSSQNVCDALIYLLGRNYNGHKLCPPGCEFILVLL